MKRFAGERYDVRRMERDFGVMWDVFDHQHADDYDGGWCQTYLLRRQAVEAAEDMNDRERGVI